MNKMVWYLIGACVVVACIWEGCKWFRIQIHYWEIGRKSKTNYIRCYKHT